jgi:DNA-damage-inducible protein J
LGEKQGLHHFPDNHFAGVAFSIFVITKGVQCMSSTITIRMNEKLKKQSEQVFKDMGLNMTVAFTIFAKTVVRLGKIPFEISSDPFYSEINQTRLRKSIADLNAGKGKAHELEEAASA